MPIVRVPSTLLSRRQYKGKGARVVFFVTFLLAFLIQMPHIHPALPGGDSGELMACCRWLLLAHPPGFPLYITLCHFISRWLVWAQHGVVAMGFSAGAAAATELERALFSPGGNYANVDFNASHIFTDNYYWIWAMHATSALFHSFAAALLATLVLRSRVAPDPRPSVWSKNSSTKTKAKKEGHHHPPSAEKQTALLAGVSVTTSVEPVRVYNSRDEVAFHLLAVMVGLAWCSCRGVLEYGTQTEVFAFNNVFVALMLHLWMAEEGVYALNSVTALPKVVTVYTKAKRSELLSLPPPPPLSKPSFPSILDGFRSPVPEHTPLEGPSEGVVKLFAIESTNQEGVSNREKSVSEATTPGKARSPLAPSSGHASPRPSSSRPPSGANNSLRHGSRASSFSGAATQPPRRPFLAPYSPRFRPLLSVYWWWAVLAALAVCHQQAILFIAAPVLLRVLYLHIMCNPRHKGITVAILLISLLLSLGICIFVYYMVVSRLIDRTHLGSWGFPDEIFRSNRVADQTHMHFASPESMLSLLFPQHSPTNLQIADQPIDASTISNFRAQPLPTYFNVGRHLLRSDYGTFKLHSGRGGFTVGLNLWVYWGRALFAVDWALQNAPWWLWVINGALVLWSVLERVVTVVSAKIARLNKGEMLSSYKPPLAPGSAKAFHTNMKVHGVRSPAGSGTGFVSPAESTPIETTSTPRFMSTSRKAIGTPNTPTSRPGYFEACYTTAFHFDEGVSTPSSTPTTATATDPTKIDEGGLVDFPLQKFSPSLEEIADAISPQLLYQATAHYNTRIRVCGLFFGLAAILFFNAMANIDLSEEKEGAKDNDQLHVSVHVYHRFWLQSLLPFALCFGATLTRAFSELLAATSIRRASPRTSAFAIGLCLAITISQCGLRAEDRLPLHYALREPSDAPWALDKAHKDAPSRIKNVPRSSKVGGGVGANIEDNWEDPPLQQYLRQYRVNVSYTLAAYSRSALASLPPHAIIVTSGDQHLTAFRFQQWVLGYRTDVVHIDRELAHYGWYRAALQEHRGVRISSPRSEPLLHSLVKNPSYVMMPNHDLPNPQTPSGGSKPSRIRRRLFALEDSTLTTSGGDHWRTVGAPVYAGWYYEIMLKRQDSRVKERLCEGEGVRETLVEMTPLLALTHNGTLNRRVSDAAKIASREDNTMPHKHFVTLYSHPWLDVPSPLRPNISVGVPLHPIDFFGQCLPRLHNVVKHYYPWEAAVLQHYSLALKNAFLAEAVRFETQCNITETSQSPPNNNEDDGPAPSVTLQRLARRVYAGLRPEYYSRSVWSTSVMPLLKALEQFL